MMAATLLGCQNNNGTRGDDTTDIYGYNVWDYVTLGQYTDLEVNAIAAGDTDDAEIRENLSNDLWAQALENATVDGYPQELYDELADAYEADVESEAEAWEMTADEYVDFFYDCDMEEYIEQNLASELVVEAIKTAEGIELDEDDYDSMAEQYLEDMGCESVEEAEELYGREDIEDFLETQLLYDFLIEHAKITEVSYDEYYGTESMDTE